MTLIGYIIIIVFLWCEIVSQFISNLISFHENWDDLSEVSGPRLPSAGDALHKYGTIGTFALSQFILLFIVFY